ncbi:MAG: hypothetical protein KatS3mg092_0429 [Patescibacteria group bacterium]|nr:MAG: hypothetical protein KatS3mg092_0429 [Patescibacteria group bacterium]
MKIKYKKPQIKKNKFIVNFIDFENLLAGCTCRCRANSVYCNDSSKCIWSCTNQGLVDRCGC